MRKWVAITAAVLFCFMAARADAATLRMNNNYVPKHPLTTQVFKPWAEEVGKVTQGRVKVKVFDSSQLSSFPQSYENLRSGVMDIGLVCPTYQPGQLVFSGVFDLPMVAAGKAAKSSVVAWEMLHKSPEIQKEFEEFEVLWVYLNPPYQIHMNKALVKTADDLKNRVVSAGGAVPVKIAQLLGASPESMPMTEVFQALQKGVVEGCMLPYAPLRSQGIADYVKFHTDVNLMGNSFFVAANKRRWDRISKEDQEAIRKISGRMMAEKTGQVFDDTQVIDVQWMQERGDEFYTVPDDERQKWRVAITPIHDDWVKRTKSDKAQALLDMVMKAMQE